MTMISSRISKKMRQDIYRRDGWRCALCDNPKGIQIHHLYPRSLGGADHPMNLITLCTECHFAIHGSAIGATPDEAKELKEWAWQAAHEYLADYYAPDWYAWDG